jgi:hypothetical protein
MLDGLGCPADRRVPMESLPSVGRRQKGGQEGVVFSQALDHRAHIVAILHDVMVRQRG